VKKRLALNLKHRKLLIALVCLVLAIVVPPIKPASAAPPRPQPSPTASTAAGATASFIRSDTSTRGNWRGVYGTDGYCVANDSQIIPGYASFAVLNQMNWTWAFSSSDPRALETSSRPGRIAAAWYSASSFSLDVNFTDGNSHPVALYAVDWDDNGRAETIQVLDANTNAVLNSQNISNFAGGIYLIWNVSGHVKINASATAGPNAVISGIFFGGAATNAAAAATFVRSDTATAGNWQGVYGADGHSLTGDSQSIPAYAAFAIQSQYNWTWASNPTDPRALETTNRTGRIAAAWYNSRGFSLDVNFTDGNSHEFALYSVDWDARRRSEAIRVVNATTNAVLDSRSISGFAGGIYVVWNISGHVRVNISTTGGPNSVASGVFFQGAGASSSDSATGTGSPATGQGQLSVSPASLAFGNVNVSGSSSKSVAISNSGTSNVTISSVSISGAGLNASGLSGVTLNPGQTTSLSVTFAPAASGSVTGGVTLLSNAKNSPISIALSGTGAQPTPASHSVGLNWSPSTSASVIGYNVYRGSASAGPFTQLNATPIPTIGYTDTAAQAGQTYYYVVTSVISGGDQSAFSNPASVTVP